MMRLMSQGPKNRFSCALPWELEGSEKTVFEGRKMSSRTAQKVRQKITAMYEVGLAKTFVTLTFVNKVDDQTAVKCLGKILREWRKDWGEFNYLWVAERQNENKKHPGNIHFHLVLDRTINIKKENARWVRLQYNSGVVYQVEKAGLSFPLEPLRMSNEAIARYVNPLDVDYIRSSHGLKMYLAGYVTKSIGDIFHCLVWHSSRGVSKLATEVMVSPSVHRDMIEQIPGQKNTYVYTRDVINRKGKVIRRAGDVILPKDQSNEFCSWVYIVNVEWAKVHTGLITELNREILAGKFDGELEVLYYDYEAYARAFFDLEDIGYKLYRKIAHSRDTMDAQFESDIKRRGLEFERDFYQYALAKRRRGYFAVYTDTPYINKIGQRFYRGKLFNPNEFVQQIKKYSYAN
jgi:hypothetical protein